MKKKIQTLLSDKFLRNSGWLGIAELFTRISRLVTTVILARVFSTYDYGIIAIIYATFEFGNVFVLKGGIGSKIIQAEESEIEVICQTSYLLNWILCILVFIIQAIAAFPIAKLYNNDDLILPLILLGLTYLTMPNFLVQSSLIKRKNKLKITALCKVFLTVTTNIMTAILALLKLGPLAVVLGIIVAYILQIFINNYYHSWKPSKDFSFTKWKEVLRFGFNILGVALLQKIRLNLDYLIVGAFLGVDALGLYYFAFNAGIGISNNVITVFTASIFPYLCEVNDNIIELRKRFINSLKKTSLVVVPIILLQSCLAPFYVPIIFGEKWISAIPILVIVCLSALPLAIYKPTIQLMNAIDQTQISLYWNIIFTIFFGTCLLIIVNQGILAVAFSVLSCQFLSPLFCIWVIRKYLFKHDKLWKEN